MAEAGGGAKGEVHALELTRGERTIAGRAAEIRATVPHVELSVAANVETALEAAEQNAVSLTAILVKCCALALREVPRANGSYRGDSLELYSRVNVGVTISTDEVHVIPTVFDADRKGLDELEAEIADLRNRATGDALRPPDLAGATFTFAETPLLSSSPLVISPQASALTAGAVHERPELDDGRLVARRTTLLS